MLTVRNFKLTAVLYTLVPRADDPPSIVMIVPVVLADRSEARNATMSPMCAGVPGG